MSRVRRRRHGEEGFSIVEMTVSLFILAVIAAFFAAQLATSYVVYGKAKDRTLAEQVATDIIEQGRALAYDDLAVSTAGVLRRTRTMTRGGVQFTATTAVKPVSDPVPGGFANVPSYKEMRVSVTRRGKTEVLADVITRIHPTEKPSLSTGVIEVRVVDYALNAPIVGATVSVSGGPSPESTIDTDGAGNARFPGLRKTTASPPTDRYLINLEAVGYQVFPDDAPPFPAAATSLLPSQVFSTVLRMFRTVTITPRLVFADGTPFPYPADVTISSVRGDETFPVTVAATISTVAGVAVIPSIEYRVVANATVFGQAVQSPRIPQTGPDGYPNVLDQEFLLVMPDIPRRAVTLRTVDSAGAAIGGVALSVTGGDMGVNLSATTAADGTAVLQLPRSTTEYTITVPAGGAVPVEVTSPLAVDGSPVTRELVVVSVPELRVFVSDALGAPAPGLVVTVAGGDQALSTTATTDVNGVATLDVPTSAVPYTVSVPASALGPAVTQRFTMGAADATYDLYLADEYTFTVLGPDGAPVPGARVELTDGDLALTIWALTDATGVSRVALPPSAIAYTITVPALPGTLPWTGQVLPDGVTTSLTINLVAP